jgi:hypothetical protein
MAGIRQALAYIQIGVVPETRGFLKHRLPVAAEAVKTAGTSGLRDDRPRAPY